MVKINYQEGQIMWGVGFWRICSLSGKKDTFTFQSPPNLLALCYVAEHGWAFNGEPAPCLRMTWFFRTPVCAFPWQVLNAEEANRIIRSSVHPLWCIYHRPGVVSGYILKTGYFWYRQGRWMTGKKSEGECKDTCWYQGRHDGCCLGLGFSKGAELGGASCEGCYLT